MSEAILIVKKHGKEYIAKRVSGHDNSRATAELNTLRHIPQGQNLNYMVEHFWDPTRTHITFTLEYCEGGTLYDKIQRRRTSGRRISETFLWHAMLGIANALAFLHSGIMDAANGQQRVQGWDTICHLDIKPQNVFLLNSGLSGSYARIVLGDFGCATAHSDILNGLTNPRVQEVGTPGWYPPECEARRNYGPKADIWMLAATIQTLGRLVDVPNRSRLGTDSAVKSSYSPTLNSSVRDMSARSDNARPDAATIVREVRRYQLRS